MIRPSKVEAVEWLVVVVAWGSNVSVVVVVADTSWGSCTDWDVRRPKTGFRRQTKIYERLMKCAVNNN